MTEEMVFSMTYEGTTWAKIGIEALDRESYFQIKAYADNTGLNTQNEYSTSNGETITVWSDPNNPKLSHLFELIRASGWTPSSTYLTSEERRQTKHFNVTITRTYKDADMDGCEYLAVTQWGKHLLTGRRGEIHDRLIVMADYVGVESGQGWKQPVGWIDVSNYCLHPSIRKAFAKAGLQGFDYIPVVWDEPALAKSEYWQVNPTIILPDCLTPVKDCGTWQEFEDGPYKPVELRYRRADLDKVGPFDIAMTKEVSSQVAKKPFATELEKHRIIVSQRFRQVCKKLKLPMEYTPVRLDAPPPELPWFFHSETAS